MTYNNKKLQEICADLKKATDDHYDTAREYFAVSTTLGWLAPLLAAAAGASFLKGYASPGTAALIAFASVVVGALKQAVGSDYEKQADKQREFGGRFKTLHERMELALDGSDQAKIDKILDDSEAIHKALPPGLPARIYHLRWPLRVAAYLVVGVLMTMLVWSFVSSIHVMTPAPEPPKLSSGK